jgi:hypothetical protein
MLLYKLSSIGLDCACLGQSKILNTKLIEIYGEGYGAGYVGQLR